LKRGLLERLNTDGVICAEGYLFAMDKHFIYGGDNALLNTSPITGIRRDLEICRGGRS
jgi:hypothetical protein